MFESKANGMTSWLLLSIFCCFALVVPVLGTDQGLDTERYISIDEIKPGMEAYCLTSYKGTKVEKFGLEVISVFRNIKPGRDAILVQGTDERFIHTGPVAGCSGSPVYIDGRMAGALAFAWSLSKDPLYGVTPIADMLRVGRASSAEQRQEPRAFSFDFSAPIDFARIQQQINGAAISPDSSVAGGGTVLPCVLIASGMPAGVCEQLNTLVQPLGFTVASGVGGGAEPDGTENVTLKPGGTIAVPLVSGDVQLTVIGTVTEVVGDRVYAFGHGFLSQGTIDMPMATGKVHTVVSNLVQSFKLASPLEVVGALTIDEATAIYGRIGAEATMIPLVINVDRYNDPEKRVYNCQIVDNRLLTPIMLGPTVAGATLMLGALPPDHMIEYEVAIGLEGAEPIVFENISSARGLNEVLAESIGSVALLMNNPYQRIRIKSMDFNIRVKPKSVISRIWSVDLSDTKIKAGEKLDVDVVIESVLSGKKKYRCTVTIPKNLAKGKYNLMIAGGYEYAKFLRKAAPHRFIPENLSSLVEALNDVLGISRDKLYCVLVLPSGGVALARAELPDLPATKALVLGNIKRTPVSQPYQQWLEISVETGTIIVDKKVMRIEVER